MIRIGLISNPNSQRNQRGLDDLHAFSASVPDLLHREVEGDGSLVRILKEFAACEVGLLVINGGDGTVQRVLTELLERPMFERLPSIAILPRGMANMTAGDIGLRGRSAAALRQLLERTRKGDLGQSMVRRSILRVENIRDWPPQRCLFFGAGAIYDAIELCCRQVYSRGLKGNLGMGLTLGGLLLSDLLGRSDGALRAHDIAVAIDGRTGDPGPTPAGPRDHAGTTDSRVPTILGPGRRRDPFHQHRASAAPPDPLGTQGALWLETGIPARRRLHQLQRGADRASSRWRHLRWMASSSSRLPLSRSC